MVFFFFKQKTAYEFVSGDWSSDVCSSDLPRLRGEGRCSPGWRPGSVRGLRLCRLAAGGLRATLGPNARFEDPASDQQHESPSEGGNPMDQETHSIILTPWLQA